MSDREGWFHLCYYCNAKWYSDTKAQDCPRCGLHVVAPLKEKPPWVVWKEQKDRNDV